MCVCVDITIYYVNYTVLAHICIKSQHTHTSSIATGHYIFVSDPNLIYPVTVCVRGSIICTAIISVLQTADSFNLGKSFVSANITIHFQLVTRNYTFHNAGSRTITNKIHASVSTTTNCYQHDDVTN